MKLCPTCQRHLRSPEARCPFCGAEQRSGAAGLIATVFLGVALTACGDRPLDETGSTGPQTSTGGGTGTGTGTGTTGTVTTGAPTSGGTSTSTGPDATTMPGPTTDGTSGTDTGSVDEGDEGCAFYAGCPPDVGPSMILCDTFAQDCPDGQKCAPMTENSEWQATGCVPVTGDKKHGEPCTANGGLDGLDDCELGALCWEVDEMGQGVCADLCGGSLANQACGPDQACVAFSEDVLFLCADECDPLMQGCPHDDVCVPFEGSFVCVLDASEDDKGAPLDPCVFTNGCDAGNACFFVPAVVSPSCDAGADGCCTPFCEVPDGPCPEPDQICKSFFELNDDPIPPGSEAIGLCVFMEP